MVFILMKYALKRDFTPNFLIYIYIYIYINCGNDEKNQPFYNNQFGYYIYIYIYILCVELRVDVHVSTSITVHITTFVTFNV